MVGGQHGAGGGFSGGPVATEALFVTQVSSVLLVGCFLAVGEGGHLVSLRGQEHLLSTQSLARGTSEKEVHGGMQE